MQRLNHAGLTASKSTYCSSPSLSTSCQHRDIERAVLIHWRVFSAIKASGSNTQTQSFNPYHSYMCAQLAIAQVSYVQYCCETPV